MSAIALVAGYTLRESLRRRVFLVVLILTTLFLVLYTVGANFAFDDLETGPAAQFGVGDLVDEREVRGSTILGLAMFSTLFLGAVLAVFLTMSAVRGDADQGLLQPMVVRPLGRTQLLVGRFLAAAAVCAAYTAVVYLIATAITRAVGGWSPDRVLGPGLGLAAGVVVIAAISLLGSVFLSANANGIAVFMAFGAGLAAGLLGQIGEALDSSNLTRVAEIVSWALPFEALYQSGLADLTADAGGVTGRVVELGPFGGAQSSGPLLWPWALAYVFLLGVIARAAFARRDL